MNKKLKRVISFLLVFVTVLSLNVTVFAEDTDNNNSTDKIVAKIGNTEYTTLAEAVEAVPNDNTETTIVLMQDIYLETIIMIKNGQNIVLDLNNQQITVSQTNGRSLYAIDNYGTLTIQDTSESKNGCITARGVENYGTMYMKSGSIASRDSNGGGAAIWNNGIFEMTGGTLEFTGQKSGNNAGSPFTNNGNNATAKITGGHLKSPYTSLFVNAGKVDVENITLSTKTPYWMAVKVVGGEINLKNVTINATLGGCIECSQGTAIIENCTFNQTEEGNPSYNSCAVAASNGGNVTVKSGTYKSSSFGAYVYNTGGTINIEGGTFNAPTVLKADDSTTSDKSVINISDGNFTGNYSIGNESTLLVSGGTFKEDISNYLEEGYDYDSPTNTVVSYVAKITTASGDEKKYTSFSEAYNEAQNEDTISVLKNAKWEVNTSKISITKSITIDLNGNQLSLENASNNKGAYLEVTNGTLTIIDSKENGKMYTKNDTYLIHLYGGNLTLQSGILEADNATRIVHVHSSKSKFIMKSGKVINHVEGSNDGNESAIGIQGANLVIIDGGDIITDNNNYPAYGMKVTSGNLTINGGNFNTGNTANLCNKSDKSNIVINKVTNISIETKSSGKITIGDDNSNENITVSELKIGTTGVVDIRDNVIVENVIPTISSGIPEYTFKSENHFGGKYGNDFSKFIVGNMLVCKEIEDSQYYNVVPIETTDYDKYVVAEILHIDGTTSYFGEAKAAITALVDGDTLILKKDIENNGTTAWSSSVSNVTINLNGHNITATKDGVSGLSFTGSAVDGQINLTGSGTIKGKNYGVLVSSTLVVGENVNLNGEQAKVGLSTKARLLLNGSVVESDCNGKFKTNVNDKDYLYKDLASAINDSTDYKVIMIGDASSSQIKATNEKKVEFDLQNHELTLTQKNGIASDGVGIDIKNGTITHTYSSDSNYAYTVSVSANGVDNSELNLENVVINVNNVKATAITVNGAKNNVKVTLKDCKINCNAENTNETVGVYFPVEKGTLNIDNTSISAANAVQVKGGTVYVTNDSQITSTGDKSEPSSGSSGCTNTGDAIYVEDTYGFNPVVYVESGTISSTNANALNYFDNKQEDATGKIVVSGGNFSNEVNLEYCASGYVPTTQKDNSGMYTVITGPKMYGCTLTLDGTIGVNFYVDMSNVNEADWENYSMKFTVNGEDKTVNLDKNAFRTFSDKTYYRFTCPVAAKQMTDTITAQIMNGGTAVSKEYTYSVRKYCENAIKNSDDDTLVTLLKAMLNYGGYAQTYFNYKTENLANKDYVDDLSSVNLEQLSNYQLKETGNLPKGIQIGSTLILESDTKIRFYITLDDSATISDYQFKLDGEKCTPIENNGVTVNRDAQYYIEVSGITANNLGKAYTLSVDDYSVSYSAMTYAYNVLNSNNADTKLPNTVKALYLYQQAAKDYQNWMKD